jgi:hypothetical protein
MNMKQARRAYRKAFQTIHSVTNDDGEVVSRRREWSKSAPGFRTWVRANLTNESKEGKLATI